MTTATVDETAAVQEPETPVEHLAKCVECECGVKFRQISPNAFSILEKFGTQSDIYGVGPDGIPMCPNGHGQMALCDEQLAPVAEAFALAAEKLSEPQQASLPGVFPAFNFEGAYKELVEKAAEVARLKSEWEDDKEAAAASKKAWEKAAELYTSMALEFERRRREKAAGPVDPAEPAQPNLITCKFAEKHPGQSCPLCDGTIADLEEPEIAPRDTEAHVDQAVEMLAKIAAVDLCEALELHAGVVVPIATARGWSDEERAEVNAWLTAADAETGVLPDSRPKVLGTSHVADEVGPDDGDQKCRECGEVILDLDTSNTGTQPYASGQLVGTDCKGAGQSYPKKGKKGRK